MTDENDLMLRTASRLGQVEKVKELISSGAHPESCDDSGKTALHYASEYGHLEIVKHIISIQRATIDQVDNMGCDALHWASKQGKQDVVETLLEEGADIHHCDKNSSTALHAAAMGGHEDTVNCLLKHGIKPSMRNNFEKTALNYAETFGHLMVAKILESSKVDDSVPSVSTQCDLQTACYFGNLNIVKKLVDFPNPDYTDLLGNTCLHIAAEQGHEKVVDVLISKRFHVDYPDKFGRTALQLAAQKGNNSMFEFLLLHGANIHHCTLKNRTVLHYAAIGGFRNLTERIFSEIVNIEVLLFTRDTFGRSAFDYAMFFQHTEVAQKLNEKMMVFATALNEQMNDHKKMYQSSTKIPVDASQDELESYLRSAARYDQYDTMVQLLDAGTSVNSKDIKGNTPLHIAAENCRDRIVSLLISRGASINQPDEAGYTALNLAARQGHTSTATLLLQNGADIENMDKEDGYTALHIAAIGGHTSMIKTLLAHRADLFIKDKYGRTALGNAIFHNRKEAQDLLESAMDEDNCNLRTACYLGNLEMVKRCIAKAQADSTDLAGNSALHLVALNKNDEVEIVNILLVWRFSIHKKDKLKRSALHLASRSGNCQITWFLLFKGADVNSLTEKNRSALHYAAMGGHRDVARILLNHGINFYLKDQYGMTALMYAEKFSEHLNLMELFLSSKTKQQKSPKVIPPPVELKVEGVTSTSVAISWQPPEDMKFIRKHQVSYTMRGGSEQLHEVQNTTSTELTSLKPHTEYTIHVRAKMVVFGEYSISITAKTRADVCKTDEEPSPAKKPKTAPPVTGSATTERTKAVPKTDEEPLPAKKPKTGKICDADIARVAGELPDWQTVARNLVMGAEEITDIENNHKDEPNRRKAFLRKWIEKYERAATYEKLCEVLKNLNQQGAAERIAQMN